MSLDRFGLDTVYYVVVVKVVVCVVEGTVPAMNDGMKSEAMYVWKKKGESAST